MDYQHIIEKGTLIYSSLPSDRKLRSWQIRESQCTVMFYEKEPLTDIETIILKLLYSCEGEEVTREELGMKLGFDMANRLYENVQFYEDRAEKVFFKKLLESSFKWKLIVEESNVLPKAEDSSDISGVEENKQVEPKKIIRLTNLGKIALEENCKFKIYKGKKQLLENINKSSLPDDSVFFPFYNALGFYSDITDIERVDDFDPDSINLRNNDELTDRIRLQSISELHIFEAKKDLLFKFPVYYVDVKLYDYEGNFYPLVFHDNVLSEPACNLLYRFENEHLRDQKIRRSLYCKLLNDTDSIISFKEIRYFEQEIEEEEFDIIINDHRTAWDDDETFEYISKNELCQYEQWGVLSHVCPVDVIIKHLKDPFVHFDFAILSFRLPINYILESADSFDWNYNIVLSRDDMTKPVAQKIMLAHVKPGEEWEWEVVSRFIDIDFVKSNINNIHISFFNLTSWLSKEDLYLVVENPTKQWDWRYFTYNVNIDLLVDNLILLKESIFTYVGYILDKVITSSIKDKCIKSESFLKMVIEAREKGMLLAYSLQNKSHYPWDDELIVFFEKTGLLSWDSTSCTPGFIQYDYVSWTKEFFEKYNSKIVTEYDLDFISKNIESIDYVQDYPSFKWNWESLSENEHFAGLYEFLSIGKDRVSYKNWLRISDIEFTEEFFSHYSLWMTSSDNTNFVSASAPSFDWIEKYETFPWQWKSLARNRNLVNDVRFCDRLRLHPEVISIWLLSANAATIEKYFDALEIAAVADKIDSIAQHSYGYGIKLWSRLSESLSIEFIQSRLSLNWDFVILSSRLAKLIDSNPSLLEAYKDRWDWNVLSQTLSGSVIASHLTKYLSLWRKDIVHDKVLSSISKELLVDKNLEFFWNWPLISKKAPLGHIFSAIKERADYLDWYAISWRLCNETYNGLEAIFENEMVSERLDWDVLNDNMQLSSILKCAYSSYARWDWSNITERCETDFIIDNLSRYADLWDWDIILSQKFSADYIQSDENLRSIKNVLSLLDDSKKEKCWESVTRAFEPYELLSLSEEKNPENGYFWDYSYIYDAIDNPELFVERPHSYVNWTAFSGCNPVNQMFTYNSDEYAYRTWKSVVRRKLKDEKFKWDFSELTKLESIQNQHALFYSIMPEKWDWDYISHYGLCLLPNKNGDANLRKYRDRLNFSLISLRTDINITDDMVSSYIDEEWDWNALSSNEKTALTFAFIFSHTEKEWDWIAISQNKSIKWDKNYLRKLCKIDRIASSISWNDVVRREELKFDDSLIKCISQFDFDWMLLTGNPSYVPSIETIQKAKDCGRANWDSISSNPGLTLDIAKHFKDDLNWSIVTSNESVINIEDGATIEELKDYLDWQYLSEKMTLSNDILLRYAPLFNWNVINKKYNYSEFSEAVIDALESFIDWNKLSKASIEFSIEFIRKYRDRWNWNSLLENPAISIIDAESIRKVFKEEVNRVRFVKNLEESDSHGYDSLKIYHFTHLYNIIDILRSKKILSRDKAMELKRLKYSSAGSVINLTSKAHPFARFYYRPKSLTQFYNECLGKDSSCGEEKYRLVGYDYNGKKIWQKYWKSYYDNAQALNLPKCPIPIFMEFDVSEVIEKMPELCYYSNGNLQRGSAQIFKVTDSPSNLATQYLYYNMTDASDLADSGPYSYDYYSEHIKRESQQEFLIKEEFDFSNIDSLRIYCMEDSHAELLKQYFADDSIISRISVRPSLFSFKNRHLTFNEEKDRISIESDYDLNGCAYMRIKGGTIINTDCIINNTSEGIIMYPMVEFSKNNPPEEIYFVDPSPYASTKEWLIFSSIISEGDSAKSEQQSEDRFQDLNYEEFPKEMSKLSIQLDRSLFYPHMVYSWHGIAHTSRVLFMSYLIANTIPDIPTDVKEGCYYAAIIHDLGKKSDREGEEHGNSSAMLYDSRLKSMISNSRICNSVLEAIRYHSVDDSLCPVTCKNNLIWKILKDADALDRSRFHGKGCDKSYLRLSIYDTLRGQKILALANVLPSLTEYNSWNSPYEEIVKSIKQYK